MIAVLGGHIDHGKSTVVTALTGRAMDPLPEERERGITLDLHVVPLDLGDGMRCGLVDVPGHERLVRTMAAGAAGTDAFVLVVAADDGVRPQTLEHCAVAAAAGIERGLVVLSKTDRVDAARAREVRAEVLRQVAGVPIHFEPPVMLPGAAGASALLAALRRLAESTPPRATRRAFRMGIDRAFSRAGQGTVATGTVLDGSVRAGDRLVVLPSGTEARVRSVHTYGAERQEASAGERVGLALAGVSCDDCDRGTVLVAAGGAWTASRRLEVRIEVSAMATEPVRRGQALQVLLGTQEARARAWPTADLLPGGEGAAWLRLDRPVVAARGDRVVLRTIAPVGTVGGAVVLDPDPPTPARRFVRLHPPDAILPELVARRAGGTPDAELALLECPGAGEMPTTGLVRVQDRWHAATAADRVRERASRIVNLEPGLGVAELRTRASSRRPALAVRAVEALVQAGQVVVRDGLAFPAGHAAEPPAPAVVSGFVELVERAGLEGVPAERAPRSEARAALKAGLLVGLPDGRLVGQVALHRFREAIRALPPSPGGWPVASFREASGLPRRLLIPLLEWTDRMGWTARQGPVRGPGPRLA